MFKKKKKSAYRNPNLLPRSQPLKQISVLRIASKRKPVLTNETTKEKKKYIYIYIYIRDTR